MHNNPIIVIGAGRSGTNILRDSLCRLSGLETWPCDEINYIWRHGNISRDTDRFTAVEANPRTIEFIKRKFNEFSEESGAEYVVEKTCANSLRIPFINEIFPNAKYLLIVRDGFDVVSSAKIRWKASLEMMYILKKVKYVPLADMPYYGGRYFINRIKKLFSKEKRLAFWGPIYPGMKNDLKKDTLTEVCGKQWKECVTTSYNDLKELADGRFYALKYENFVKEPVAEFNKITKFLGFSFSEKELKQAVGKVSPKSIGNYKKHLNQDEIQRLTPIISPVMETIYNSDLI